MKRFALGFYICLQASLCWAHPAGHQRIAQLDDLLAEQGGSHAVYVARALEYLSLGEWTAALADLNRAAELGNSVALQMARGKYHDSLGDHATAASLYRELVLGNSGGAEAHLNLARSLARANQIDASAAAYDSYFALLPVSHPGDYRSAAELMVSRGEEGRRAALRLLDDGLIRLGPNSQLQRLAVTLEQESGQHDRALVRWNTMGPTLNHNSFWQLEMAVLEQSAGHMPAAERRLQAAMTELESQRKTPARMGLLKEAAELMASIRAIR